MTWTISARGVCLGFCLRSGTAVPQMPSGVKPQHLEAKQSDALQFREEIFGAVVSAPSPKIPLATMTDAYTIAATRKPIDAGFPG